MSHVPHCSLATCTPKASPCGVEGPGSIGWQFDTEAIGVADRPDYWSQAIAQALHVDVSVEPLVDTPFGIRMALQDWGCLRLLHVQGSAHRSRRRGPGRADELALVLQFDGVCEIGGRGRRATLGPGDVAIMAPDFECVHAPRGNYSHALLDFGLEQAQELLPQWKNQVGHTFSAQHPASAALRGLARWMLDHGPRLPEDARAGFASSLLALIPGLAQADAAPGPSPASPARAPMARAQRRRVEDFVRENLADTALDVPMIARELGLSVRYVHKLFAGGPGVMQWVLEQRLQACHDELGRRGTRSVSSIAYGWGFASPSHFSRAFRRRFGISPSQV